MKHEFKSDFIISEDRKIHYYYHQNHSKDSIIFLHGAMDNGLCFSPIARKFTEDYYVIMPDLRGHGLTETQDKEFSYELMTKDIDILKEKLDLNGSILIGHSMGAYIGLYYAYQYPSEIKGLILEDPGFQLMNSSKIKKKIIRFFMRILMPFFLRGSYKSLLKRGGKKNPKWSDDELKPWAHSKVQFKEKNPKDLLGLFEDSYNWKEIIMKISCPILLITSSDGFTKDAIAKEMMKLNGKLQWVKIEGAGHNIRREQYDDYINSIQSFLNIL